MQIVGSHQIKLEIFCQCFNLQIVTEKNHKMRMLRIMFFLLSFKLIFQAHHLYFHTFWAYCHVCVNRIWCSIFCTYALHSQTENVVSANRMQFDLFCTKPSTFSICRRRISYKILSATFRISSCVSLRKFPAIAPPSCRCLMSGMEASRSVKYVWNQMLLSVCMLICSHVVHTHIHTQFWCLMNSLHKNSIRMQCVQDLLIIYHF